MRSRMWRAMLASAHTTGVLTANTKWSASTSFSKLVQLTRIVADGKTFCQMYRALRECSSPVKRIMHLGSIPRSEAAFRMFSASSTELSKSTSILSMEDKSGNIRRFNRASAFFAPGKIYGQLPKARREPGNIFRNSNALFIFLIVPVASRFLCAAP